MTSDETFSGSGVSPREPGSTTSGETEQIDRADRNAIEPLPREHDTPRPLIIAMVALIFIAVASAFYLIDRLGVAENVLGRVDDADREGSVSSIEEMLQEPVKQNLMGRDVMLWRVPVESVVGNYTFWIGPDRERSVPVVLMGEHTSRQNEVQTEIREGDVLVVVGSIRPIRDLRLLDEDWMAKPVEWERLKQNEIYVSALRVEHLEK